MILNNEWVNNQVKEELKRDLEKNENENLKSMGHSKSSSLKKKRFYLFIFRGREKERERNINVWLPLVCPPTGDLACNPCSCALTRNRTATFWYTGQSSNQLCQLARVKPFFNISLILYCFWNNEVHNYYPQGVK